MAEIGLIKRVKYAGDVHAELLKAGWDLDTATAFVNNIPDADVAPVRHGRIVGSLEDGRYRRRFSCCGEDATMITEWAWPKYCPNCGAKMDG